MKKLILALLVLVMAFSLIACGTTQTDDGDTTVIMEDGKTYGEGANEFTFEVVDKEGTKITATIKTDKSTVGEALEELGLIAGHDTEYGLYIDTVNGTTLSWDTDKMYWGFYIDGEYAMTGVDSTDIVSGATYTIQAEKGE